MSGTKRLDSAARQKLAERFFERIERQAREPEARRRARRAEVAETRAYLESVAAEDPAHELFLAYLRRLVERLQAPDGFAESPESEIYRLALRAFVPLAARGESQTAPSADLFRQLGVPESRETTSIPAIRRLDLTKNLSLLGADFVAVERLYGDFHRVGRSELRRLLAGDHGSVGRS